MQVKEKTYDGWTLCSNCKKMTHELQIDGDLSVCPHCGHHELLNSDQRIHLVADKGTFKELFSDVKARDILGFVDKKPYKQRLDEIREKSGKEAAVVVGECEIDGVKTALGVMDFSFMGGSLGSAEGERLTRLIEHATKNRLPLVIFSASGGARMQESMFSLMQMAKTSQALKRHSEEKLLYVSVLTHPTMGGVSASFAFLGDIILAEPEALIGFTGPRVIQQTIGEKLKPSDQRAEFQLDAGMIDQIVHRKDMKKTLSFFINMLKREEG